MTRSWLCRCRVLVQPHSSSSNNFLAAGNKKLKEETIVPMGTESGGCRGTGECSEARLGAAGSNQVGAAFETQWLSLQ